MPLVAFTCAICLLATAAAARVTRAHRGPRRPLRRSSSPPTRKRPGRRCPRTVPPFPVLLYHGIGPESDFSDEADAAYGIDVDDFAKQMTMIAHAGYQTIDLRTFRRFVQGEAVELPPRPLLLTFDDARANSWTGGDGILEKLGFKAVMFVDVGRVEDGNPEYLTWDELQTVEGERPLGAPAPLGPRPHADPVRAGAE